MPLSSNALSAGNDGARRRRTLKPDDPALHYVRGLWFKSHGDPVKVFAEFKRSTQIAPQVPETHYEIGLLLRQRGELVSAVGESRKAIELSPTDDLRFSTLLRFLGCKARGQSRRSDAQIQAGWAESRCRQKSTARETIRAFGWSSKARSAQG
jgi:tetratricopeptide (TPR) repeat protein